LRCRPAAPPGLKSKTRLRTTEATWPNSERRHRSRRSDKSKSRSE
jgi:hypothetical protein